MLERVPAAAANRRLEPLRVQVATHPHDMQAALRLAQAYLQIGKATADPRFISYAQATLGPWVRGPGAPPVALVLDATALQHLHRFDQALVLLERALEVDPRNAQALITKATVLQVQGRFDEARSACRPLVQAAGQLIALTCLTSINSLTGQLARSYQALHTVFTDDPRLPVELRAWVIGQLADMAVRLGDLRAAEAHYRAALTIVPDDIYLKGDYADLLLLEHRPAEVIPLLRENEAQDNLLLRLAIAGTQLRTSDGQRWSELFRARFEAARRDGDRTHLREQARYFLEVRPEPLRALILAQDNFAVQREPADVRIYARTASSAHVPQATRAVRAWIERTRYEDHTLADVLAQAPEVARR